MTESKNFSAVILGLAIIASAAVFGFLYHSAQAVNSKDVLAVTGSTKTRVTSDQAKLVVSLSRTARQEELSNGKKEIARDLSLVRELFQSAGIDMSGVNESPLSMYQAYDQYNTGVVRYQFSQSVTLQSSDVNKITEISKKIPDLVDKGALVSIQSLEYYYSKLPDLRVSLLTEAVKDAKVRADKIASGTGRRVGGVQSASIGVVQVVSPNSVDVSDYGNYDTSSIEKDVMVTVKATFRLE